MRRSSSRRGGGLALLCFFDAHSAVPLLLVLLLLVACPLSVCLQSASAEQEARTSDSFPRHVPSPRYASNSVQGEAFTIEVPSRQVLQAAFVSESSASTRLLQSLHYNDNKHHMVDSDGFASIAGVGRTNRPRGISITRGLPIASGLLEEDHHYSRPRVDDHAITFGPERLDMGTQATCQPVLWFVDIINRGRVDVRLDDLEVTREGFEVITDVRGMILAPTARLTVQFLLTPGQPEAHYEAFMRVFTSSGQFSLLITASIVPNPFLINGIRAIIPVGTQFDTTLYMYNPFDKLVRVLDVFSLDPMGTLSMPNGVTAISPPPTARSGGPRSGVWGLDSGSEKPIINYAFTPHKAGIYFTYIRIVISGNWQLRIPVMLEAVHEGIHLEPSQVSLGTITARDAHREVFVNIHNAASVPVKLYDMQIVEATMDLAVALNGPSVIPPRSRVRQALGIDVRGLGKEGDCVASLSLRTNHSASSAVVLRLSATFLNGSISYRFEETLVGVVIPLSEVFAATNEKEERSAASDRLLSTNTFSLNGSEGVEAGQTTNRTLHLKNMYSIPVELERVWVESETMSPSPINVTHFEAGVAASGAYWPEIRLRVNPVADGLFMPRSYPLQVETNVAKHRVNVYFFYGILHVRSPQGGLVSNYSTDGYLPAVKAKGTKPPKECTPVHANASMHASKGGVKLCRSFLLDFGKVSASGTRTKMLNLTNVNPIPIDVKIASLIKSELFDFSIVSSTATARHAPVEVAVLGQQWNDDDLLQRSSPSMNITSSMNAPREKKPKAKRFRLHEDTVIPPGFEFAIHIGLQVKHECGTFSKYLLTLETPFEYIHVYARFESVKGTIVPVVPHITLPPMFPGHAAVVDIQYRSTFAHDVSLRGVTYPSSLVQVFSISVEFRGNDTVSAVTLLFSPAYSDACSRSRFYADCYLPDALGSEGTVPTTVALSDFGEFVTADDIAAFERRRRVWERFESPGSQNPSVQATVQLHADVMDLEPVTISAPMIRPSITTSDMPYEFLLTKVLECSYLHIEVRNPSSISIDVELAVAEHDRSLFFECKDDMDADKCKREWESLVLDGADPLTQQDVAPFYFPNRVLRVAAGETAQLGPVYFSPSRIQTINATIYVRNELTHIEPVVLIARSGQGSLSLHLVAEEQFAESEETTERAPGMGTSDEIIYFRVPDNESSVSSSAAQQLIALTNIGNYDLQVIMAMVENESLPWLHGIFSLEAQIPDGYYPIDHNAQLKIYPGRTTIIRLVYEPNCYLSRLEVVLRIEADGVEKRIPVIAEVTPGAAFACLRAKWPTHFIGLLHAVWKLAAFVASTLAVYSVYLALDDVMILYRRRVSLHSNASYSGSGDLAFTNKESTDAFALDREDREAVYATSQFLNELKANFYSPDTRVQTPAVTKLLVGRQKKLSSLTLPPKERSGNDAGAQGSEKPMTGAQHPESILGVDENTDVTNTIAAVVEETRIKEIEESSSQPIPDKDRGAAKKSKTKRASARQIQQEQTRLVSKEEDSVSKSSIEANVKSDTVEASALDDSAVLHEKKIQRAKPRGADRKSKAKRAQRERQKGGHGPADHVPAAESNSPADGSRQLDTSNDVPEPTDILASSIDSTSTTVSSKSENGKLSPPTSEQHPESNVENSEDDFFLSMQLESPFSSFGMIGKQRAKSPRPQARPVRRDGGKHHQEEEEDGVIVERFGLSGPVSDMAAANGGSALQGNVLSLETVEDDWSDLYFDSIRSEIGRLVSSGDTNSEFLEDQASRTAQRPADPLGFSLSDRLPPPSELVGLSRTASIAHVSASVSTTAAPAMKKTPPGFTPADADPVESLAAFERLRSAQNAASSVHTTSLPPTGPSASALPPFASPRVGNATSSARSQEASTRTPTSSSTSCSTSSSSSSSRFAFASRLSLFGPTLPSSAALPNVAITTASSSNASSIGMATTMGRIGSGREGVAVPTAAAGAIATPAPGGGTGGRGFGVPDHVQRSPVTPAPSLTHRRDVMFERHALATLGGVELLPSPSTSTSSSSSSSSPSVRDMY